MEVFVITKTYFTGFDQYTHITQVCATQEVADQVVAGILMLSDKVGCVNCHVSKHNLIGF